MPMPSPQAHGQEQHHKNAMRAAKKLTILLFPLFLFISIFCIQTTAFDPHPVLGYVYYPDSQPAIDVTIILTNINTGETYQKTTTTNGYYQATFADWNPGDVLTINATVDGWRGSLTTAFDTSVPQFIPDLYLTDIQPPIIHDLSPSIAYTGHTYQFIASISDNAIVENAYVEYWYQHGNRHNHTLQQQGDNWRYQITIPQTATGKLSYIIVARDTTGNWNHTGQQSIPIHDIDDNPPTITDIVATPSTQHLNGWVNISCTATDDTKIASINITIIAQTTNISAKMQSTIADHYWYNATYPTPGLYNYTINAIDTAGNSKTSDVHHFYILPHLQANFTYIPTNPATNEIIELTDLSYISNGSIINWTWNFGDGNNSTLQNPTHSYTKAGTYTVTLTITNTNNDTNSITRQIEIKNPSGDKTPGFTLILLVFSAIVIYYLGIIPRRKNEF